MIRDEKKWNVGLSLLNGFMQHLPASPDEELVEQFHGIVKILEEASGEDFSYFKIPAEKLAPKLTSIRPGGYGGGPGSATYSKKKYCESSYFRSQVHGLANYIGTMDVKSSAKKRNPYESLTDDQLMAMLADRNIKPKRVHGRNPEYVYDRSHAIAALLADDNPPAPTAPSASSIQHVYHLTGDNARVNVNSTDQSTNVVTRTSEQIFADLRAQLNSIARPEERTEVLSRLDELERAQGSPSFAQKYTEFIGAAANHMTLLAPFIPVLTEMLKKALS
jgi:hypothetical protein